jgi:hypothetical protein
MTIKELFLKTILNSYEKLKREGLIKNPWPVTKRRIMTEIMKAEYRTLRDVAME